MNIYQTKRGRIMGILDALNATSIKNENEELKKQIDVFQSMLTPEMRDAVHLKNMTMRLQAEKNGLESEIKSLNGTISTLNAEVDAKRDKLIMMDEEILLQEFALYTPQYAFTHSEEYKNRLDEIRQTQKNMIKAGTAATGNMNWTVNNSTLKGQKMVKDMQKLLIRAFNSECDDVISNVKYNNYESSLKRITASFDAVSKSGAIMSISISNAYFDSKKSELALSLEYQQQKQREKEDQKVLREQMREEARLQKEIEDAKKTIEKEQKHYQNAMDKAILSLASAKSPEEKAEWQGKINELQDNLVEIEKNLQDIDYRAANKRAGYVYVISNVGSFGENVYKIGMTRRLEPMDRVDELGDASVPFNFDVHAMIFSDDAPKLEAALHNAFADRKINMINHRREFFNVSLEEIEKVIKRNFEKNVDFIKTAYAEQFRESMKMRVGGMPVQIVPPASVTLAPVPASVPSQPNVSQPVQQEPIDPNEKYIFTKWGHYKMPATYKVHLPYGLPL